jgi:hypothetical protein
MKRHAAKKVTSENIRRIDNNHHIESTSRAWFHPDHIDLRIGVVQVTTSEPSEIVFPLLDRGRDAVKKWMGAGSLGNTWCNMLRDDIAKMAVILRSAQLHMSREYINWNSPEHWLDLVPGHLGQVLEWDMDPQVPIPRASLVREFLHQMD